uniref:Ig-like domain-containing protein n=1 Tax=Astyanax mexicanus TaxID=7994 RepID=A0A3B1JKC7_ASTMX
MVYWIFTASYVSGASGAEWSMNYTQQEICALNGSTVFMNGTFTHPEQLTVKKSFWAIDPVKNVEPNDLSKDPNYSGRVINLIDKRKFYLKLSNVTKKDEHRYCFRIITNKPDQKCRTSLKNVGTGQQKAGKLHVESPGEVTEGQSVNLTCKTTCSLTDPTFIWYKDGRPLTTEMIQKNQQLHLQTVSSEDAGSYSCAQETLKSDLSLDPPKSVSVSISPSGGIVEGSSVNLTCSSDGDPPVEIYTWFKEGGDSPVGSGHSYVPLQSGSYYCQAQNQHGTQRSMTLCTLKSHFIHLLLPTGKIYIYIYIYIIYIYIHIYIYIT